MRTKDRTVGGGGVEGDELAPLPEDGRSPLIEAGVLLAAELSLPVLLRRLVEIAVQITRARYGALGVMGPQGEISEFITVGLSAEERAAIGPIPSGRGILGALIHEPQPLRLTRIQDDPRSVGFPPHHPPMTTFLGAPVRARGQVFGNLYLTDKEGGQTFDAADQAAAVTLATQAGVAIANAEIYRELQQRERWLGALHEITAALLAGEPQPGVLATIVRSARNMIGADLAAIALPVDVGSTALRIVAADGIGSDRLLSAPGRPSGTASHSVLSTGRPLLARLASVDFQAHLVSDAVPVGVLMVVPLLLRERVNGTIVLTRSASDADFNSNDLSLLETFASQAALTLDHDRFEAQSRALAVIEERHRIARELHDEPIQALIYLARRLEAMSVESSTAVTASTKLEETRELAVAVVDGLRQLTEGLRSEILNIEGLAAALQDLVRRFTLRTGIPARFSIRGTPARWDPELERNLFRLAQEALSNIERHAEARRVRLDLFVRAGGLTIRVADDGVGFVTSGQGAISPGLGTIGMQERVALYGGRLLIRSRPGRGTVLLATVLATQGPDRGGNHPWA
jgi:signal transduction histidine kinase